MELDTEKFKSLNELMQVQQQIGVIRAELLAEKSTLEQFKLDKEKEALTIVEGVLTASKEALVEADKNRDAIASLLAVARDCANDVVRSHDELKELVAFYIQHFDATLASLEAKSKSLEVTLSEIRVQRQQVLDDEKNLQLRRQALSKEKIFVEDRKQFLLKEIDRIKNKLK